MLNVITAPVDFDFIPPLPPVQPALASACTEHLEGPNGTSTNEADCNRLAASDDIVTVGAECSLGPAASSGSNSPSEEQRRTSTPGLLTAEAESKCAAAGEGSCLPFQQQRTFVPDCVKAEAECTRPAPSEDSQSTTTRRTTNLKSRFWKGVVRMLYVAYLEHRLGILFEALAHLRAEHWRQVIGFVEGMAGFLSQLPDQESAPPALPLAILSNIIDGYITGNAMAPDNFEGARPMWYLEAMLWVRFLLQPLPPDSSPLGAPRRNPFRRGDDLSASHCSQRNEPSDPSGALNGRVEAGRRSALDEHVINVDAAARVAPEMQQCSHPPDDSQHGCLPPKVIQFISHLFCSKAMPAYLRTLGSLSHQKLALTIDGANLPSSSNFLLALDQAWARHGADVLLACHHILIRLYPDPERVVELHEQRTRPLAAETPSFLAVITAASFHFAAQLSAFYNGIPSSPASDKHIAKRVRYQSFSRDPVFTHILCQMGLFRDDNEQSGGSVDKYLICIRDVLQQLLGPCPADPRNLPAVIDPLPPPGDKMLISSLDIKTLARVARTFIQAYLVDAAREQVDEFELEARYGTKPSGSGPTDVVQTEDEGPLQRNYCFMEESALLRVVRSKLCAQPFEDITASNEQFEKFALRNLRVMWLDLRRCTSTLKRIEDKPKTNEAGAQTAMALVLRNLRPCLVHEWDAKLATFPYVGLSGSGQVAVQDMTIFVHLRPCYAKGILFNEVDVRVSDLDIQLSCTSAFSQVLLSAILRIFRATLREHIQKQLQKNILHLLQAGGNEWNARTWRHLRTYIPAQLVSNGISWIWDHIPPEGLPV